MKEDVHYFSRLLVLLLTTLIICLALYGLPETIFEQEIKKVDFFSDIRSDSTGKGEMEALRAQLAASETDEEASLIPRDSLSLVEDMALDTVVAQQGPIDSAAYSLAQRDSLSRMIRSSQVGDPRGERIEDYSDGHAGLRRFFEALRRSRTRPVRIAFLGDSFIEGDIMVGDFRNSLQQQFGGHGVGFVPINSVSAGFRSTIDQHGEGWTAYSIIDNKEQKFILSGMFFKANAEQAKLSFRTASKFALLRNVSSLKFLYDRNEDTYMQLVYNAGDSVSMSLPPTNKIEQFELVGTVNDGAFTFSNTKGFRALGIALEDNTGVIVDNFSLRGNSGLIYEYLDPTVCESLHAVRPYDLIVLQYGLNVIDKTSLDYDWYRTRMTAVIEHLQRCFPESDVLLLSVSDRANQYNGTVSTMPAVLSLLHVQRQIARQAHIPFWNMFGSMGGENSILTYVQKGWAGKDYTHMTFKGGREIARNLMKVLMKEKEYYDELDRYQ